MRAECSVTNCGQPVHGHGLCNRHYRNTRAAGKAVSDLELYKRRLAEYLATVDRSDQTIEYPIARGSAVTIIDVEDLDVVAQHMWHIDSGYAQTNIAVPGQGQRRLRLHNLIFPAPSGMEVDHINRIRVDNRRSNLRHATKGIQSYNRIWSAERGLPRGVIQLPSGNFQARIRIEGDLHALGTFSDADSAFAEYARVAMAHWGFLPGISKDEEDG